MKKQTITNGVFIDYQTSLQRVHERVDNNTNDLTQLKTAIFGDPSHGIEGFIQKQDKLNERNKVIQQIEIFIGSTVMVALIGMLIKLFFFMGGK